MMMMIYCLFFCFASILYFVHFRMSPTFAQLLYVSSRLSQFTFVEVLSIRTDSEDSTSSLSTVSHILKCSLRYLSLLHGDQFFNYSEVAKQRMFLLWCFAFEKFLKRFVQVCTIPSLLISPCFSLFSFCRTFFCLSFICFSLLSTFHLSSHAWSIRHPFRYFLLDHSIPFFFFSFLTPWINCYVWSFRFILFVC